MEVHIINYRKDGPALATHCPFTNPEKRGLGPMVASSYCTQICKHFIAHDSGRWIIICNHPGAPVFCKKDKKNNP